MALGVGQRQYTEPVSSGDLRSLSAKRAAIIKWHKQHPHSFRLFTKADLQVDRTNAKIRSYHETLQRLEKQIGAIRSARKKLPLAASLARVSNLMEIAEKDVAAQTKARNILANRIYEWRSELPYLDGQIAEARNQLR